MTRVQGLSLAIAATLGAAWIAQANVHTVCRVVIVDDAGERWVAGEGDTLKAALVGAELVAGRVTFEGAGCYQ